MALPKRSRVLLLLSSVLLLAGCQWFLGMIRPIQPNLGDYGDAPDEMDAGYYMFQGAGFGVYSLVPAGVRAEFPTIGREDPAGAYTRDVDEFWIGRFMSQANPADIPSLEADADDPNDPDGFPNIRRPMPMQTWLADCDQENGAHNPAATNCRPVPPFSIPMNAIVVIVIWPPQVIGIFITSVTAAQTVGQEMAHWNVLFDLNQNGRWDGNEWVVEDRAFPLNPGMPTLLVSRPFGWPTSGGGFGRLAFPIWVRNMATVESVRAVVGGRWDGRGPRNGFSVGEVEDYLVEWRPFGPMPGPEAPAPPTTVAPPDSTAVLVMQCPEAVDSGRTFDCELTSPAPPAVSVTCLANVEQGGESAGLARLSRDAAEGAVCSTESFSASAALGPSSISVHVDRAPPGGGILLFVEPPKELQRGTGSVAVTGGALVRIR